MRQEHLEAAVPVGADPRRYARVLARVHEAAYIMVVVDGDAYVLWREGSNAVRHRADRLGFTEGTWSYPLSRLRRRLGTILARRLYRFADDLEVVLERPESPELVLPHSTAPALRNA